MAIKGYTVPTIFTAVDRMSSVLGQMQGRVNAFQSKISAMRATTGKLLTGMGDRMITRGLTVGSVAVGALGKKAIQTASEFEAIKTAIRFVSGDAANAEKNLAFLDETVNTLKIDYAVTAESLKRFMGAMKATNIPADKQRKMFYEMASSTRVLGMSGEQTERVFYALGEMFSKGQVMSQELKLQLGNVLPGAVKMFATSMGKSVPQLMDMMNKGAIDSEKYVAGFTAYVYEQFKGGIPDAVKTMNASLMSMENKWKRTLETIGIAMNRAGILTMIEGYLDGISRWVTANQELIKSGFQGFLEGVKNVFSWIYEHWDSIVSGLEIYLQLWMGLKVVNGLLLVTKLILTALSLNPFVLIAGAIAGLAIVTKDWNKALGLAGENTRSLLTDWERAKSADVWDWMSEGVNILLHGISRVLKAVVWLLDTLTFGKVDYFDDMMAQLDTWQTTFSNTFNTFDKKSKSLYFPNILEQKGDFDYGAAAAKNFGLTKYLSPYVSNVTEKGDVYNEYSRGIYDTESQKPINIELVRQRAAENSTVIEIKLTTDKGTSAEVVSSSGAIPVTVTTNNNAFSLVR